MTVSVFIILGLLPYHLCFAVNINEIAQKVSNFIDFVGWTKITVVCSSDDKQCVEISTKITKLSRQVIITNITSGACNYNTSIYYDTSLILMVPSTKMDSSDMKCFLHPVKVASAYTSLIISADDAWKGTLNLSLGFYYLNVHIHSVIRKVTLTRKAEDPSSFESRETTNLLSFNMEGAYMHVVTMPYKPYLELSRCLPNKPCEVVTGFTYELLQAVATDANFTMSVYMHEPQEWGTVPRIIDGDVRPATGVIKSVLDGETDLPLSVWIPTSFRFSYLDFTFSFHYMRYRCFAHANQVSKSGWKFMIKPLTLSAWIGVLLTTFLIFVFERLVFSLGSCHYITYKIILVVGGISFTLLLSFYSGAQTMFLASIKDVPFNNILEGLTNHNDWTFLLPYGDENIFLNLFGHMSDDPSMAWIFAQAEKYRADPISITEAFNMLDKGKYYVLTSPICVASNLDDETLRPLSVFCDTAKIHKPRAFMLPKNSPFKRAINQGLIRMRNIGVLDMQIRKLRAIEIETKFGPANQGSKGIDFQHVSLMFYTGAGVVIMVLILICCEIYNPITIQTC